jgi:hypothetical protein
MQKWEKLGLLVKVPLNNASWKSHAMLPFAEHQLDDVFRIYFSGRDSKNRSHIRCVDISIPQGEVYWVSEGSVFDIGELGCFDDNGVTPSWIVNYQQQKFLYYIGWNPRSTVRMKLYAGLAISSDNGETFQRYSRVPVLDRTDAEPFINTAPCVLLEDRIFRCWYVCGTEWRNPDLPRYHIRYAESVDGKNWQRNGQVCIDFKKGENALARPSVMREGDLYRMWYSYKGDHYRIGYAESRNGLEWVRKDEEIDLAPSESGWDASMIEYSHVFDHKGARYMLYNGDNYGKGGIGLAMLKN